MLFVLLGNCWITKHPQRSPRPVVTPKLGERLCEWRTPVSSYAAAPGLLKETLMSQQYPPAQVQQPSKQGNGLGLAALIIGIIAVVFGIIPLVGLVAFILGPIAVILGVIGMTRKLRPKGTSITGAILGLVAIIIAGIITSSLAGSVSSLDDEISNIQSSATAAPDPDSTTQQTEETAEAVPAEEITATATEETTEAPSGSSNTVVYEVTSDAPTAGNVSYATFDNGGMGQEQVADTPLPFSNEVDLGDAEFLETNIFSLVAQATDGATTISCKITANGEVLSEQTSTGQFAVVSCSGSAG